MSTRFSWKWSPPANGCLSSRKSGWPLGDRERPTHWPTAMRVCSIQGRAWSAILHLIAETHCQTRWTGVMRWSCTRAGGGRGERAQMDSSRSAADVRRQTPSHDPQDTGGRLDVLACHTPPARTRDKKCTIWACDVAASVRSNVIVRSTGADTCANAATPLRRGGTVYLSMCVVACFVSWFFFLVFCPNNIAPLCSSS